MAFVTTFVSKSSGRGSNAYNIDVSVGPGVRGNQPVDIMLVQALFRIIHFEVKAPLPKPPGETKIIAVDGKLGPVAVRYLLNAQRIAKASGERVRLGGIFDQASASEGGLTALPGRASPSDDGGHFKPRRAFS